MASLDSNVMIQPTMSPHQHVADDNKSMQDIFDFSSSSSMMPGNVNLQQSPIRITRMFDIRRVLNSEEELRLSFDVPAGISASDLKVQIQHDKELHPEIYTLRVMGNNTNAHTTNNHSKTFPLNAKSVNLFKVKAVLDSRNNVLRVIAPKKQQEPQEFANSSSNTLVAMAVEALQAISLSVSNYASWSSNDPDQILREVPIVDDNMMAC
ncbi:expressed unknown protein [Seminavis robusta]|uniref:Uncharacterized protein n=1 Tax=Seminavis robusta TaxID=568900 RepID=A0A9N8H3T9_9STRA|nr:expressed unknown protein [Seminavis robusta]|eukprot:Sro33_g021550.1 n/a (209) ;mRNA; f:105855-106481